MNRLNWSIVLFTICCFQASTVFTQGQSDSVCGDWEQYKNEKCFKVFTSVGAVSFERAQKECDAAGAHLISIKLVDEQQFLSNFLFNKSKVVDYVWLNARFQANKLKLAQNGSDAAFTNWAAGRPKATTDDRCVQIDPESDSKWLDEPCIRAGAVVCQKNQTWTLANLQNTLLKTIKQLEMTKNRLTSTEGQFEAKLTEAQAQLKEAQHKLKASETLTAETNIQLEKIEKNLIPLGFIYSQLSGQPEPATLWPATKWEEVSGNYSGQFFRVSGGGAAQFGEVQNENAPHLVGVREFTEGSGGLASNELSLLANNEWSNWVYTGTVYGITMYLGFKISSGEVRPHNQAMRLWKRTG